MCVCVCVCVYMCVCVCVCVCVCALCVCTVYALCTVCACMHTHTHTSYLTIQTDLYTLHASHKLMSAQNTTMMLPLTIVNTIQNVYKTSHPFPALLWFATVYGLSASHCFVRQWNGSKRLWLAVCGRLARVDCLRTRVFRSLKHVRNDLSVWVVHPRTRHAMMSLHKCSLASTHTHTQNP